MHDRLLKDALKLPDSERALLAREILSSLDGPADSGAVKAWVQEIERRVQEVRDGTVQLVDWPDVRKRIEGRLAQRK